MDSLGQELKVDDLVAYVNAYGTIIGYRVIKEAVETPGEKPGYILHKSDAPWFPVPGKYLTKVDLSECPNIDLSVYKS